MEINPWANGHSVQVLRGVAAGIVPSVSGYEAEPVLMQGVLGELIRMPGTQTGERVILYFHGGAYLCGSPQQYRNITVGLAQAAGVNLYAVDYRLAPEQGHPAAFEDALSAYAWLCDIHPEADIIIAGDSAGAAIAVATALDSAKTGCRAPLAVLCNSPFADLTLASASLDDPSRNQAEPKRATIEWLVQTVVSASNSPLPRDEPRVSPVFRDLRGLPPLLVQTGGLDNLEDDGIRLAQQAQSCGVKVTLTRYPGCPHIWPVLAPAEQNTNSMAAIQEMVSFINHCVETSG